MPEAIVTPLTQALSEGKLTRAELRAFMRRSNGPAFRHLALWIVLLALTATGVALAWDSWLIWPAMFVHGVVLVHHFSLQHECVHYTVFRTRWLNDLVGNICGAIIILPHQFFRYEHCDHHTHTQIDGDDPELVPMPRTFGQYLLYLSAIPYWRTKIRELVRHAAGRIDLHEKRFLPKVAERTVIREARIMLALYTALALTMLATGWTAPLWFWFIPLVLGEPVMRFIRMTEHVGRPMVAQMHDNTRTNLVSWPWRFLSWNMNYHAEHHYVASVPFHALPRLHRKLKDHVHVEPGGYLGAHRDILRQLRHGG
ncbi:fatty acid desaturase family protein [Oceaniglobus roseus]|uniref:fatty acid desaturase family protein n=1 Tax=Oceaniglobus roseus TaxID=1737570 RepID=UPI000C7ED766|nr:fatty acid desaturase family protein [Kandeliimicrobium roseum]